MRKLNERIFSDENIILAINYAINDEHESIYTPDYKKYDIADDNQMNELIDKVKEKLTLLINDENYFLSANLYLKPKKYDEGKFEYRPLYVFKDFEDLAAQYALLNVLVYDEDNGKLSLNKVMQLIPSYFYGNLVQESSKKMFATWNVQYSKYSKKYFDIYENENEKYKYEINIDLKSFYPSINLRYLFIYLSKLYKKFYEEDYSNLLLKCLLVHVKNGEENKNETFLEHVCKDNLSEKYYNKGLPQGLPQSKIFSNLLSIIIDEEYAKMYGGRRIFYVDDVIIFTNIEKIKASEKIEIIGDERKIPENDLCVLADIFSNINTRLKSLQSDQENKLLRGLSRIYNWDESEIIYNNDKYNRITIKDSEKYEYLNRFFARKISNSSYAFNTYLDHDSKDPLFSQMYFYYRIISDELADASLEENVKHKFEQYKKFYKNRSYSLSNSIDKFELKIFIEEEISKMNQKDSKTLLKYINDDCILVLINLINTNLDNEEKAIYIGQIKDIFAKAKLLDVQYYNLYLDGRNYQRATNMYLTDKTNDIIYRKLSFYNKTSNAKKNEILSELFQIDYSSLDLFETLKKILKIAKISYDEKQLVKYRIIVQNDVFIIKKMLNIVLSILFNVAYSNKIPTTTLNGLFLCECQYRILFFVRSRTFNLLETTQIIKNNILGNNLYNSIVDGEMLAVAPYFEKNINSTMRINCLMDIHNYVKNIWSNGSKYLYFYTLHNHSHSIELIFNIEKIKDRIEYFSFNKDEYFYLYLACYLHDISMVMENNKVKDIFFSHYPSILDSLEETKKNINKHVLNEELLKYMFELFKNIEKFIEEKIRENHAKNSGNYIKLIKHKDLEKSIKDTIAEISVSHGDDAANIYYKKDSDNLINLKLMKIMLRFADLLDMSKNRVSTEFLEMIKEEMPPFSQFHYLSHAIVDGFDIYKTYKLSQGKEHKKNTDLEKYYQNIVLVIHLNQYVDVANHKCSKVEKCYKTQFITSYKQIRLHDLFKNDIEIYASNSNGILVEIDDEIFNTTQCIEGKNCTFMCEWLNFKNIYLINELHYLSNYINNCVFRDNAYKTMKVKFSIYYEIDNIHNDTVVTDQMKKILNDIK